MAISVNKVYTAVLSILNKKGNGELNPDHFNKIAKIAQLDLLDKSFNEYNRAVVKETGGRGASYYGDLVRKAQDKLDAFFTTEEIIVLVNGGLSLVADRFNNRSDQNTYNTQINAPDGEYTNVELFTRGNTNKAYATVTVNDSVITDVTITATGKGFAIGNTLRMGSLTSTTDLSTTYINNWTTSITVDDLIRDGFGVCDLPTNTSGEINVYTILKASTSNRTIDIERIDQSRLPFILSSPLTAPTETFPAYYSNGVTVTLLPVNTSGTWSLGNVTLDYVRLPVDPVWGKTVDISTFGTPVYTYKADRSTDFELHPSEEVELVLTILQYFGITIKDPAVVNAALNEKQSNFQEENL